MGPLIQARLANQNFQCDCVGRKLMSSPGELGTRCSRVCPVGQSEVPGPWTGARGRDAPRRRVLAHTRVSKWPRTTPATKCQGWESHQGCLSQSPFFYVKLLYSAEPGLHPTNTQHTRVTNVFWGWGLMLMAGTPLRDMWEFPGTQPSTLAGVFRPTWQQCAFATGR